MTPAPRRLAVWTATHENGWTTGATENPDGTFSAWATSEPAGTIRPDYLEDSPENARRAAEYAIEQKTGHAQCSPACSGWHLRIHTAYADETTAE